MNPRKPLSLCASRLAGFALVVMTVGAITGCATTSATREAESADARFVALEHRFGQFVSAKLDRGAENEPLGDADLQRTLERETRALQALRLSYLDVVGRAKARPRLQMLALMRIGELHLDFAARIRRIDYPADASAEDRVRFDAELSRRAAPFEATGLGVMQQAQRVATSADVHDHYARRIEAYLALHAGASLSRAHVATLSAELSRRGAFPAPRRLLEPLRVGQRAARR